MLVAETGVIANAVGIMLVVSLGITMIVVTGGGMLSILCR